ncbi:MAG: glycosyltransferase family 2 protein [Paracoccus sp. (in: a-proteobacteria)]
MPQRHVLLSSMKNEGPFILEFVAHHRVLGFDAIHIASNDSSDGTARLLDALAEQGVVTHTRNKLKPGQIPQHVGYRRIRNQHDIQAADWIMVLDVDEFLMVDRGNRRIGDLTVLAGPEVDLITLNAMNFGTNKDPSWRAGRVTRQFTRRLPVKSPSNRMVKSISRGHGLWESMHNHHPDRFTGERDICHMRSNGETATVPNDGKPWLYLRNFEPKQITHKYAWYNHYPIKSIDSYLMRRARGRGAMPIGGEEKVRHTMAYWERFARASIQDRRIETFYGAETAAEIERLLALPGVRIAQERAERLYGQMVADIANAPDI